MPSIRPFRDDIDDKSLHTLWNKKVYCFLRDFFSTVEMAPPQDYDEMGNPIIHRVPGTGVGWEIPWGGGGGGGGLNQFEVSVVQGENKNTLLVTVLGGTAQAIFGTSTMIPTVEEQRVSISSGYYCFVSAVYKITDPDNGDAYVHEFEEDLDFHVGHGPPQSTLKTAYFPIAVIDSDGHVLQGHLGAIYLASPRNTVDKPD